jgi:hypothetical protein
MNENRLATYLRCVYIIVRGSGQAIAEDTLKREAIKRRPT